MKTLMMTLVMASAIFMTSCGSGAKKAATDEAITGVADATPGLELNGDSDSGKAGGLQSVYFDFNTAELRAETRTTLDANAQFLKDNATVEVQVEGHCDERGGVQYNLALGEKRAIAVRDYLTAMGVDSKRISIISFGKERPVSFGHAEDAWAQNRRGNFVVTAK